MKCFNVTEVKRHFGTIANNNQIALIMKHASIGKFDFLVVFGDDVPGKTLIGVMTEG